jgi:hypothetical protein
VTGSAPRSAPRGGRGDGLLLVDFDHTLFDVHRFLTAAADIAAVEGVAEPEFFSSFRQIIASSEAAIYDFDRHLAVLAPSIRGDPARLAAGLDALLDSSAEFLFPDAVPFLERCRALGVRVEVVTFGKNEVRRRQLASSGFGRLIDRAHIVTASKTAKVEEIGRLCSGVTPAILVDDDPSILSALVGRGIRLVRIRRLPDHGRGLPEPALPGVPVLPSLAAATAVVTRLLHSA